MGVENKRDIAIATAELDRDLERNIPPLDRRFALLYLLAFKGNLTTDDIIHLSTVLYRDGQTNRVRSLREVSEEASILPSKDPVRHHRFGAIRGKMLDALFGKVLDRDAFLNHTVPRYEVDEMEWEYTGNGYDNPNLHRSEGYQGPIGEIDARAGGGTPRPLLYELYLLEGDSEICNLNEVHKNSFFLPSVE